MTLRAQFAKTASRLLDENERLVVLLGDIGVFAMRDAMMKHPRRCLNLGVLEQGSVSFAAGLALQDYYPVFSSIDAFVVRRAYEQIMIGFGLQKMPGAFVTVGGSRDYQKLGPTHCAPEAPTLMAQIPGMHIRMPITPETVDLAISTAVEKRQLSYIRLEESAVVQAAEPSRKVLHLPLAGAKNGLDTGPGRPGRPPAA